MGVRIEPADWADPRAVALRAQMDREMQKLYGDRPSSRSAEVARVLTVPAEDLALTLLALDDDDQALGHLAVRRRGPEWELKRLIVRVEARNRGVARALVEAATAHVAAQGAARVVLQTGDRQPGAVRLYERLGWTPIPVFPPYEVMPSLCFQYVFTRPGGATASPG